MTERDAAQLAASPQPQPIRELVIRKERWPGSYSSLEAKIDSDGQLVLDGADGGASVRDTCGDWDYEYTETVSAEWKDTVLLHLLKERFERTSDFRQWCEARRIPRKFWSWT
jgi:hypothetical protein